MSRTKTGVSPGVDIMEPRLLLSTAASRLTENASTAVVSEIKAIVSTLAETDDTAQASNQLTGLSSQVPSGSRALDQSWQRDLGLYRPHSARSTMTTEKRLIAALDHILQNSDNGGNRPVSGSGSTTPTTPSQGTGGITIPAPAPTPTPGQSTIGTPTPTSTSSLDSVRIQNTTGLALVVTIHLDVPQIQQPYITETIPAQGNTIALFNFGTSTGAFMTMDVKRADNGQSPPPWSGIYLSQPNSGYNGVVFTVSVFSSYFSVNAPA